MDSDLEEDTEVDTLIFDGVHVAHRENVDLDAAMREVEKQVKMRLGYTIQLKEKELYRLPVGDEDEGDSMDTAI